MKFVNIFQKGVIADLDNTFVSSDQWVFPTENVRIFDTEGHGLTITNLQGNTNSLTAGGEEFNITDGFIPLGRCEFGGIMFILSYNLTTLEGELGTYPSPTALQWDSTFNIWTIALGGTGFERVYKPLIMYDLLNHLMPMRSTLFNFSQSYQYSMFVKMKSDNTYDIYIADHHNYNRKINSVFDNTGLFHPENHIYLVDFPDNIIQVNISKDIIDFNLLAVEAGGVLLPGNYFVFMRYATSTYDRTGFIDDFGPIQVFSGSNTVDIEGENYIVPTDKRIYMELSNLDTIYPYIEIGVVRYYGELSGEMYDIYLLSDLIINTGTVQFYITGDQTVEVLTLAELLKPDMKELICKDHLQLWNYYIGANWKEVSYDEDAFIEFAKLIRPNWNCSHTIDDVTIATLDGYVTGTPDPPNEMQYKDYEMTLDRTGYLRGEIYPFAVAFKLTDGRIVGSYPIEDVDYWDALNPVYPGTYKGLMRFPARNAAYLTPQTQVINDIDKVMGATFIVAAAHAYYLAHPNSFKNVIGIYILRGERIDNFICQGFMMNTVWGADDKDGVSFKSNYKLLPFYNLPWSVGGDPALTTEYIPITYVDPPDDPTLPASWQYGNDDVQVPEQYLSLFSVDNLLSLDSKVIDGQNIVIKSQYFLANTHIGVGTFVDPDEVSIDFQTTDYTLNLTIDKEIAAYDVQKGVTSGSKGGILWRSECDEGDFYSREIFALGALLPVYNRYMSSAKYIGLHDTEAPLLSYIYASHIVNLYHTDPSAGGYFTVKYATFSVPNEKYHKISDLTKIDDLSAGPLSLWKGDCFLQRTIFRQRSWRMLPDNRNWEDVNNYVYGQGFLISMITENLINSAMRHDDNEHTYYPKCIEIYDNLLIDHLTSENFVAKSQLDIAADEAMMYNGGYHKVLSPWHLLGYDSTKPYQVTHYPTRIRISAKHIPGTYYDAFMIFDINSYVDFDSANGPINAIAKSLDYLISIQDDAINQHYFSQTEMQPGTEEEYIVLGRGPILSDNVRRIAEFGSQHMNSIITGMMGVYGVDYKRKVIWRSTPTTSSYGTRYMDAADLTKGKGIRKWVEELALNIGGTSDIVSVFPDTPSLGEGIVSGYDRVNNELLFTILSEGHDKTLVFNEGLEIFTGEYTMYPHIYMNINEEFFSSRMSNAVFKHNQGDNLRFYDTRNPMRISVVANGNSQEQNMALLTKLFKSLEILVNDITFENIEYSTETQNVLVTPFLDLTRFWMTPEYMEGKWLVPVAPDVLERDMRGKWLKITLTFYGDDKLVMNSIITNYITSNV